MRKKLMALAMLLGVMSVALVPATASAQLSFENIGETLGLGEADLKETTINILQFALGFMALVAVVFVIYGGFTWLTAGGNEDRVEKAKRIISAAVVGIIVVLLAWAIVIFVANTTVNVTNNNP